MAPLRIPHTIGSSAVIGEGERPELWALYSLDDASEPTPAWRDASADVRSFTVSRGRDSELDEIDAGTASLTLDNRDRAYDPGYSVGIRPLNRWWLRSQYAGETQDIFSGYAESYTQSWPDPVADQVAAVSLVDEFKVLNLNRLPTMDPPRDTYADVILYDNPAGYWKLDGDVYQGSEATVGNKLNLIPTSWTSISSPIVGSDFTTGAAKTLAAANVFQMITEYSPELNMGGLPEFAVEFWFRSNNVAPAGGDDIVKGPFNVAATRLQYQITLNASGQIVGKTYNSVGTLYTVTSSAIYADTWYHVVLTLYSGLLRLYLNGTQVSSVAAVGVFEAGSSSGVTEFGDLTGVAAFGFDEVAIYRAGMTQARVSAHYAAGLSRGYVQQGATARINNVLDTVSSAAPRSIRTATRNVRAVFMHGQEALSELLYALEAENVDAMLFISAGGEVVFLDAGHRIASPWSTAQLTFDDDGSDLPYLDLELDYSESFLFNEWNVTREEGLVQTRSDSTSIASFFKRSASLGGIGVAADTDADAIAVSLLAKYKDPLTRIVAIEPNMSDPDTAAGVLARELGDRIRILRTPLGGGTRIDQSPWIQKIEISAGPGGPWRCRLAVSPR